MRSNSQFWHARKTLKRALLCGFHIYIYMLATPCDGEPAHKVLPDKDGLNRTTLVGEESEKRTRLGEHRAIVKEFYRFQASLAASAPYRKHVGICPAHQIFEVLSQDAVNLPVLPPRTKP